MKKCFKCKKELPLSDFYKHSQMGDGYLGKCRSCARKDSLKYRSLNLDKIREYDRKRGSRQNKYYLAEYRAKFPNKNLAHKLISKAIHGGKLYREPCEVCKQDSQIHAHHDDYLKPLNVRWLCAIHHKKWHVKNGEGLNP